MRQVVSHHYLFLISSRLKGCACAVRTWCVCGSPVRHWSGGDGGRLCGGGGDCERPAHHTITHVTINNPYTWESTHKTINNPSVRA